MLKEIKLLEYRATQKNMKTNYRVLGTCIQVIKLLLQAITIFLTEILFTGFFRSNVQTYKVGYRKEVMRYNKDSGCKLFLDIQYFCKRERGTASHGLHICWKENEKSVLIFLHNIYCNNS